MANHKQITKSTTKEFVEIADIRDSIVILKNGSLRSVLEVNSMNFELKSVDEQTAIVRAFQNFLNAVDFPLQIVVSSRKLNIEPYIKSLDDVINNQQNELLKIQATEYARFVKGLTELANIMAKKFYVVVPFYAVETPTTKRNLFSTFKSLFIPDKFIRSLSDEELDKYKIQLNQRVGVVIEGIAGMGLEGKPLNKEQLVDMYYQYYNPGHHL
jgi:type IV secretory pathway VirB4 component